MTDIVIMLTKGTFERIVMSGDAAINSRKLSAAPKDFNMGDRIYFGKGRMVMGSFLCTEFNPGKDRTIVWDPRSWVPLKKPKYVPHQVYGFIYRRWK